MVIRMSGDCRPCRARSTRGSRGADRGADLAGGERPDAAATRSIPTSGARRLRSTSVARAHSGGCSTVQPWVGSSENRPSSTGTLPGLACRSRWGTTACHRASAMTAHACLYVGGRGERLTEPGPGGRAHAGVQRGESGRVPHGHCASSPTNAPTGVRWAPGGECLAATLAGFGRPGIDGETRRSRHTVGRLTEFWARMEQVLNGLLLLVSDHVLDELGGRTVERHCATAMMPSRCGGRWWPICSFRPPFGELSGRVGPHRTGVRYSYPQVEHVKAICRTASVASRRREKRH